MNGPYVFWRFCRGNGDVMNYSCYWCVDVIEHGMKAV